MGSSAGARPLPLRAPDRRARAFPRQGASNHVRLALAMTGGLFVLNFFSPAFVDQLKRGRKTATIRLGDKSRKYERGQVVWVTVGYQHSPREKIFSAVIDDVEVKRVKRALPARHRARQPRVPPPRRDGQLPRADLRPRRSTEDDTVTVIRFSQIVEPPARSSATARRRRRTSAAGCASSTSFLTTWCLERRARAGLGRDLRVRALAASGGAGWSPSRAPGRRRRDGVGAGRALHVALAGCPTTLDFEMTHDQGRAPHLLEGDARRRARRDGRWRLFEQDGADAP